MLTLYKPGNGWLHRMPAGPKLLLIMAVVLAVSLLPARWPSAWISVLAAVGAYLLAGLGPGLTGLRELGKQLAAVRWVIVIIVVSQLIFMGPEPAVVNAARVSAALLLAGLLALTTRVTDLLDAIERGLRPLERFGLDAQRIALLLTVTISTIPVLGRRAGEVRDAQWARGARNNPRTFVVPFLIVALKHADELADALTARGVR